MNRTNIYLDERQTTALDRLARAEGVSRAEVVRRLIDRSLGDRSDEFAGDLAAIHASFGALRDGPHAGADSGTGRRPDARAAHLEHIRHR